MLLMAHRGFPWEWPENTLVSFRKAIEAGADILEFDVRMTADGVPVIMHDATLDRTTDGRGLVAKLSRRELNSHRVYYTKTSRSVTGAPIPTLQETVDLLLDYKAVQINCEIKDYSDYCIDQTVRMFSSAGLVARTVFTCFDFRVLHQIKARDPSIRVQGFPLELMAGVPEGADLTWFDHIGVKFSLATGTEIARYKSLGLWTGVWVVNEPRDLWKAVEMRADSVCSDRVDLCARLLGAQVEGGRRNPKP